MRSATRGVRKIGGYVGAKWYILDVLKQHKSSIKYELFDLIF